MNVAHGFVVATQDIPTPAPLAYAAAVWLRFIKYIAPNLRPQPKKPPRTPRACDNSNFGLRCIGRRPCIPERVRKLFLFFLGGGYFVMMAMSLYYFGGLFARWPPEVYLSIIGCIFMVGIGLACIIPGNPEVQQRFQRMGFNTRNQT